MGAAEGGFDSPEKGTIWQNSALIHLQLFPFKILKTNNYDDGDEDDNDDENEDDNAMAMTMMMMSK